MITHLDPRWKPQSEYQIENLQGINETSDRSLFNFTYKQIPSKHYFRFSIYL